MSVRRLYAEGARGHHSRGHEHREGVGGHPLCEHLLLLILPQRGHALLVVALPLHIVLARPRLEVFLRSHRRPHLTLLAVAMR